ncbi:class I SAM-dependent methyltransferase [Amycolatopsis tucumanensis]|uniref:Class I SAM-dependent methyltransferase n=1 Tax=Amycolatopsis tucumanensis TaxID=401106 RepID=A0ABP7HMR4_9PSEU|nr:methyltransferase domain-containing protein [Amycolatopsis tucumanensis]MCF6420754.1 methyltransferase domain-containing protein [Amycolatopsis tucumanensis]
MSVPPTGLAATRAFFGPRAATWELKFPDDGPRYRRAVADLAPPAGGVVADIACGTGRALPELRDAVGPGGTVLGVDVTPEMLAEAAARGRHRVAALLLGDALHLPFRTGALDAVFAAGLVSHLPDPVDGLRELARVCRPGGRLALFHPVGRAALARRQGRELTPDDLRAEPNIRAALTAAGWRLDDIDDGEDRYLVLATVH